MFAALSRNATSKRTDKQHPLERRGDIPTYPAPKINLTNHCSRDSEQFITVERQLEASTTLLRTTLSHSLPFSFFLSLFCPRFGAIHSQLRCSKPTRCIAARSLLRNYPNAHNFSSLKLWLAGPKFRLGEFQRHFRDFSAIRRLPRTRSYLASWPTLHISRGLRGYTN